MSISSLQSREGATPTPQPVLPAPAKINLFLHVTGRREDGYHCLQTLFQFLDYADQLAFEVNTDGLIQRIDNHPFDLPDEDLCIQAARLLRQHARRPELGCRLGLTKVIPPGSGLGGGSSNAATTLVALNRLWGLELGPDTLIALARQLGADVPVFVHGHAAWAEGVGDQFKDFSPRQDWYLVVIPPVSVATARVFSDSGLRRDHPAIDIDGYSYNRTCNDLQPVTTALFPEVAHALRALDRCAGQVAGGGQSTPATARMSGSGCAVFLPCPGEQSAAAARNKVLDFLNGRPGGSMPDKPYRAFIARGTNRSPLHTALEEFAAA